MPVNDSVDALAGAFATCSADFVRGEPVPPPEEPKRDDGPEDGQFSPFVIN